MRHCTWTHYNANAAKIPIRVHLRWLFNGYVIMRNVLQLQIWDVQKLLPSKIDPQILRPIEQIPNESIRKLALCVGVSTFILLFVVLCMTKDFPTTSNVLKALQLGDPACRIVFWQWLTRIPILFLLVLWKNFIIQNCRA
jgi:hypothetical protein